MPTILSHLAVPLAIGLAVGSPTVSKRLLLGGLVASVLPDLDVLAFKLGISYSHEFGHRGFSHSLVFAACFATLAAGFARQFQAAPKVVFAFLLVSMASHGLLDMLTNGGLGVALAWPFSEQRFFLPWQVIEASPLSLRRFFGPAGLAVLKSELAWVWVPCMLFGLGIHLTRRKNA